MARTAVGSVGKAKGKARRARPIRPPDFRVVELLQLIQDCRYPSVRQIAERFECSVRTAERYIEKVRDLVAEDLVYDNKRKGYTFAAGGPRLPKLRLSEGEAAAMFLAAKLLYQCRGTPYEWAVAGALRKLSFLFPKEVTLEDVAQPAGWVSFRVEPLRGEETKVMESFLRLERAIEARETVRVRYFTASRGEWNDRDIDPYHLHFQDGIWYILAHCHRRGKVTVFAVDRIETIAPTDRRFEAPEGFSVEAFLKSSFRIEVGDPVDVAIRFAPEQARYVRGKRWHESQEIEELPDAGGQVGTGGLVLRMRVGGLGEVKRWVLSFGAGAEVLGPEELRVAVAGEAEETATLYRSVP
jgi:predicted DNA-binding transcriptional regulator YafY